jgi:5-methyltetrahydropteroyltriglutamate--homocysteine methyltransferase
MRRSDAKILTTHVGNLPILDGMDFSAGDEANLGANVARIFKMQRDCGIDICNEGEYTKGGDWLSFVEKRFSGFEAREWPAGEKPIILQGKDRADFADFYRYAQETGKLFYNPTKQIHADRRPMWVCTSTIGYVGQDALKREIELTKQAANGEEAFLTSTAPASLEPYRRNAFYKTELDFLQGMADALAVEYRAIVESGLILQIDDAWLPALWDRIGMDMGLENFRRRCMARVEILNSALKGLPEDRVRYHLCWGSWHGPHAYDLELEKIVDIMLAVKAGAYLIEGANARHEHEWALWEKVKLPAGKILIPGVITHSTDIIEHPELVSQRLRRYAKLVGRENVIAGADCGFGGRSHPQIAWAKLGAMVEGARLATKALW